MERPKIIKLNQINKKANYAKKQLYKQTYNTGIVLDEENQILLSYDLLSNSKIDASTEGILKELNEEIADEVSIMVPDTPFLFVSRSSLLSSNGFYMLRVLPILLV